MGEQVWGCEQPLVQPVMPGGPGQQLESTFLHGVRIRASLSSPMSRLQQLPVALQRSLEQRSTLKVIAGLMNFDAASVGRVAAAAGARGFLVYTVVSAGDRARFLRGFDRFF